MLQKVWYGIPQVDIQHIFTLNFKLNIFDTLQSI